MPSRVGWNGPETRDAERHEQQHDGRHGSHRSSLSDARRHGACELRACNSMRGSDVSAQYVIAIHRALLGGLQ
jgi:hypothetical protein